MAFVSDSAFLVCCFQTVFEVKMLVVTDLTISMLGKCKHFFLFYNSLKLKFAITCKKTPFYSVI